MNARKYLVEHVSCDKLTARRDGTFELRKAYSCKREGMTTAFTASLWGERVMKAAGNAFLLEHVSDEWREWPTTSYFVAVLRGVDA